MSRPWDAVVVGAGPNGLSAGIVLARAGCRVLIVETRDTIGGGCRSGEITRPGFVHDICAAIHPLAAISPAFANLPLHAHGLEWIDPPAALAHPFDDGSAAVLHRSLEHTGATIGIDGAAWSRLFAPLLGAGEALLHEVLKPIRVPRRPVLMSRFGLLALQSCASLVRRRFEGSRARALFAGCAAHSFLPLDASGSASFGIVLAAIGHIAAWPVVRGGSQYLVEALASHFRAIGGAIETGRHIRTLSDLPASQTILFDLMPRGVEQIAGDALPAWYRTRLRSFRHGPGAFKVDWALRGPVPWKAREVGTAATVHVGGTFEEIAESEDAACRGRPAERPFVIVAQQSLFDPARAPAGCETGWAYCHVPHGSRVDMTDRIENQIERFAPGFRECILARRATSPADLEAYNANNIGGDIGGGSNDLRQMLFRPFPRWDPYSTPNPRFFLCSSATPPGGGVHGMCGYWAAHSALRRIRRFGGRG